MAFLRNYLDKIRPNFEKDGKLHAFKSIYDGMDTFLYVPNATSKSGVSIHDAIDLRHLLAHVVDYITHVAAHEQRYYTYEDDTANAHSGFGSAAHAASVLEIVTLSSSV